MKLVVSVFGVLLTGVLWLSMDMKAGQPANMLATCSQFANNRYRAANQGTFGRILLFPQGLVVETPNGKIGRQYVGKVLSGDGLFLLKQGEPLGIQFTCLMEHEQKTVFFHARPAPVQDPVHDCDMGASGDQKAVSCLKNALKREEQTLAQMEKTVRDHSGSNAGTLLSLSSLQWRRYRDAECVRRLSVRPEGSPAEVMEYECRIHKTRQRIEDLRSER